MTFAFPDTASIYIRQIVLIQLLHIFNCRRTGFYCRYLKKLRIPKRRRQRMVLPYRQLLSASSQSLLRQCLGGGIVGVRLIDGFGEGTDLFFDGSPHLFILIYGLRSDVGRIRIHG